MYPTTKETKIRNHSHKFDMLQASFSVKDDLVQLGEIGKVG